MREDVEASERPRATRRGPFLAQATRFRRTVCRAEDVRAARRAVVSGAAELLNTPWVGLTRHGPPRDVAFVASSDDVVRHIGRVATALREGICWQVYRDGADFVCSDDLATDGRWPEYRRAVLATLPIRSVLGVALRTDSTTRVGGAGDTVDGALLLYSAEPAYFDDRLVQEAQALADHASLCLAFVAGQQKVRNLEIALRTSREIGIALGIVMDRLRLPERDAFEVLRAASQARHVKIRDLAGQIALTGELPAGGA
jgi:hypothetical protein